MQELEIDNWIATCYEPLKQRVMMTHYFDEDVFQDTYLALREIGSFSSNMEADFMKIYRRLLSREFSFDMKFSHPDPLFFNLLSEDSEPQAEEANDPIRTIKQVDRTCKAILSEDDYTIYRLRYKIGMTLKEIAAYTGRAATAIYNRLNEIARRIRDYFRPAQVRIAI